MIRTADGRLSERGILALLMLAAFALRAADFGNPVIHVDEQYYLLVGDRMLHGALPYIDVWDRKPIGLFAIFAAVRLLPGDGILAYQIVATLFVGATGYMVWRGANKLGAARAGAFAAAIAYIIWIAFHSGRGGQSPVFYNLFMAAAAVLTLRLPALAEMRSVRGIVANGAIACLLAGLAIQTKYTPAIEGAFFGAAHIVYLHRAGARWPVILGGAMLWLSAGLVPTLAAAAFYWVRGPAAWEAFRYANFESILQRSHYNYPPDLIARRLAGITALESPLLILAGITAARTPRSQEMRLALGWLVAAIVGFLILGTFFDHYVLPVVAPLAMLAAVTLGRDRRIIAGVLALGLVTLAVRWIMLPRDGANALAVARVVEANSAGGCPYVYTGDSITYYLAHTCLPSPYAFPSMLAYKPEQGAHQIDEAAEVRRILANRPPVIVARSRPLAEWNTATHPLVAAALVRDYRPVFSAPREDYRMIVYLRRDRRYVSPGAGEP